MSIRKVSRLGGLQYGLVEARGRDLAIVSIDSSMRTMLAWPEDQPLPTSVYDLLPENLHCTHRSHIDKAAREGTLPSSLLHPLRNLPLVRWGGAVHRVDICVGVITKARDRRHFRALVYVLLLKDRASFPRGD